jgi:SecD/SecF fusion protein
MHSFSSFPAILAAADGLVRKSPQITFFWGVVLVFLLFYYLGTADHRRKKVVGTVLSVLMSLFCIWAINGWNVFAGKPINLKLGMDLAGGSEFTVQLKPGTDDKGQPKKVTPDAVQQAIGIIEKRLNPEGAKDLVMAPQGEDRILIQMPGVSLEEVADVRNKLEQTAHLEFRLVHPQSTQKLQESKATGTPVFGWVELPGSEHKDNPDYPKSYLVSSRSDLEGKYVKEAFPSYDAGGNNVIILHFDSEGADLFGKLTSAHVGEQLAIVVDGVVLSAPQLKGPILGGQCEISGKFKQQEARALATALENPLENPMEIIAENNVSAQFGQQTIMQGIYTGIAGLIMTALFSVIYYRLAGLVALVGLVVTLLMVFGSMSLFDFTLTMPGIAGIVLSVGMAVDANVLIYERLREEMRAGKSLVTALDAAFEKAFSAIFDANITTLISAVILFYLGSGLVKGFAITLAVGIVGSLLGALIVTRVVFQWFTDANVLKKISVTEIIPQGIFNVLAYAKPFIIGSFALAVLSIVIFPIKGADAIGIDFRGGTLTRFDVKAGETVDAHEVEKVLKDGGIEGTYVQENTTGTGTLISVRSETDDKQNVKDVVEKSFAGKLLGGQSESVGSIVGKELAIKSSIAFAIAMICIFIYLVIFYEFSFAVGAIIALLHDCMITIGVAVMLGQQLSIIHISALLTVAGYSINDTIVVFDRIREIIRSRNGEIRDIMNEAISMTLSRTLLTGVTTLGPMAALYFFGGPAMKDLSLPIIIGVLVGTYSSIYIASPIVLWWAKVTGKSLRRQVLDRTASDAKPTLAA